MIRGSEFLIMKERKNLRITFTETLLIFFLVLSPGILLGQTEPERIEAITLPSCDVMLSFVRGGRVAEVRISEGDRVKTDQLLARQEDDVEQIQFQQLAAKAEDTTRIKTAEAQLSQKKKDLEKLIWARKKGGVTDWEVEHTKLEVRLAELSHQMARFEHEQDCRKRDEAKAQLERMRLLSPVDGFVEEVGVEVGESAQALKPLLRVVRIDPLWIDVPVPLSRAYDLKAEHLVRVVFPGPEGENAEKDTKGRIKFISAVAHAASDTIRVRVELPNPSHRPAGERVGVIFTGSE